MDISKDGMLFAPIKYLYNALNEFSKLLKANLPKQGDPKKLISQKLAVIHNEFNVIHPFREGNGRTIRLFLDLLVVNIGYNPIDWSKNSNSLYLKACIEGASQKNQKMMKIIEEGLNKSM